MKLREKKPRWYGGCNPWEEKRSQWVLRDMLTGEQWMDPRWDDGKKIVKIGVEK